VRKTGIAALQAAVGGSLLLRSNRLPKDMGAFTTTLRQHGSTSTLFVCLYGRDRLGDLLCPSIEIPSFKQRMPDLPSLVDACIGDAAEALGVTGPKFSEPARTSVIAHVKSLSELEKTTRRLVALMTAPSAGQAAQRLDMTRVGLVYWVRRRPWVQAILRERDESGSADLE
jgi:hypothetical protein